MSVYKEEKTNTWRVVYRYTDWKGERKQTQKRGFKTKHEAQAWEREKLNVTAADLDMTFGSFIEQYTEDMKKPHKREHVGNQRAYNPQQASPVLREAENEQYYRSADHNMAE